MDAKVEDRKTRVKHFLKRIKKVKCTFGKKCNNNLPEKQKFQNNEMYQSFETTNENNIISKKSSNKNKLELEYQKTRDGVNTDRRRKPRELTWSKNDKKSRFKYQIGMLQIPIETSHIDCRKKSSSLCSNKKKPRDKFNQVSRTEFQGSQFELNTDDTQHIRNPKEIFHTKEGFEHEESQLEINTDDTECRKNSKGSCSNKRKPKVPMVSKGKAINTMEYKESEIKTHTEDTQRRENPRMIFNRKKKPKIVKDLSRISYKREHGIESEKFQAEGLVQREQDVESHEDSLVEKGEETESHVEIITHKDQGIESHESHKESLVHKGEKTESHAEVQVEKDIEAASHESPKQVQVHQEQTIKSDQSNVKINAKNVECGKRPNSPCKRKLSLSGVSFHKKQETEYHTAQAETLLNKEQTAEFQAADDEVHNEKEVESQDKTLESKVELSQSHAEALIHHETGTEPQKPQNQAVIHKEQAIETHESAVEQNNKNEECKNPNKPCRRILSLSGILSHVKKESQVSHTEVKNHSVQTTESHASDVKVDTENLQKPSVPQLVIHAKQENLSRESHVNVTSANEQKPNVPEVLVHKEQETAFEDSHSQVSVHKDIGIQSGSEVLTTKKQITESHGSNVEVAQKQESHESDVERGTESQEYHKTHGLLEANSVVNKKRIIKQNAMSSGTFDASHEDHENSEEQSYSTSNKQTFKSQKYMDNKTALLSDLVFNRNGFESRETIGLQAYEDEICSRSPCGINANCRSEGGRAICTCDFGSFGNPLVLCQPGSCIRDEQCDDHLSCVDGQCLDLCHKSCGVNAFCEMRQHKPVCECLLGYKGNPHVECKHSEICSPNPCGANTLCKSVEGKPVCVCAPGYEGDPWKGCKHECEHDTDCAKNQACMDFTCQDACKLCGKYADCQSVAVHKPVCKCPANYYGNPYVACKPECTEHAECPKNKPTCYQFKCKNPCDGACGAHANCQIQGTEAICSCPEHLTGNPRVLCRPYERKDFCEPFPCGGNAKCELGVDDHGKYMAVCNCLPGFYKLKDGDCMPGDCEEDFHCPDHKACIDFMCDDPCVGECGTNSFCETHNHTAICSCNSGYEGNPVLGCTKRVKCTTKTFCSGRTPMKILQGK